MKKNAETNKGISVFLFKTRSYTTSTKVRSFLLNNTSPKKKKTAVIPRLRKIIGVGTEPAP